MSTSVKTVPEGEKASSSSGAPAVTCNEDVCGIPSPPGGITNINTVEHKDNTSFHFGFQDIFNLNFEKVDTSFSTKPATVAPPAPLSASLDQNVGTLIYAVRRPG